MVLTDFRKEHKITVNDKIGLFMVPWYYHVQRRVTFSEDIGFKEIGAHTNVR